MNDIEDNKISVTDVAPFCLQTVKCTTIIIMQTFYSYVAVEISPVRSMFPVVMSHLRMVAINAFRDRFFQLFILICLWSSMMYFGRTNSVMMPSGCLQHKIKKKII